MNLEQREARITAFALNDPGLSPDERAEIETLLANDAETRHAVEETRQLAQILSAGLAAEQAGIPTPKAVAIPAAVRPNHTLVARALPVLAASVVGFAAAASIFLVYANRRADQVRTLEAERIELTRQLALRESEVGKARRYSNWSETTTTKNASDPQNEKMLATPDGSTKVPSSSPLVTATGDGVPAPIDPSPNPTTATVVSPPNPGLPTKSDRGSGGPVSGMGAGTTNAGGKSALPGGPPSGPGIPGPGGGVPGGGPAPGGAGVGFIPPPGTSAPVVRAVPGLKAPTGGLPANVESPPAIDPSAAPAPEPRRDSDKGDAIGNDRFNQTVENPFIAVQGMNALSTFGVDVDTASYSIVRNYLRMGQLPPANAVRLEEMVNYFPYADKAPDGNDPFAVTVEMAECPWEPTHRLVRLGLKAKPIASDKRPASNLVFLIDVSGSMNEPNKLPLVKASLKMLVNQLGEKDRVAMVVYAGASGLVLESTPATKKEKILEALEKLEAGGSTNGAGGLEQAYEVAVANFVKEGTNRVILCTDGDWNVGTTSTEALERLIEGKRKTGVFLSVFGFGMGNLRDEMMVKLAGKGNGNYGYIDTLKEANKAFVEQMGGTLVTIAKDVKIQVEFNPAAVRSYRLLGYEKRALAAKDFHDDKKDAGEMGAGHVVTALYELVPVGAVDPVVGKVDGLRYQKNPEPKPVAKSDNVDEAFVVKMRHKKPDSDTSTLREVPVTNVSKHFEKASEDFQFAAAVASFSMLLRDSAYKGSSNYALVLELAEAAKKHDPGEYRAEFMEMVRKAKSLSGK